MKKFAESIEREVQPEVFFTLSVKQGIQNDRGVFINGDREAYDRAMTGLLNDTAKRLRRGRQRRRRLSNLSTVERGRFGRNHIHGCIKLPPGVKFTEFRNAFIASWERSSWYLPKYDVQFLTGNAVGYILKEGQESILLSATHVPTLTESAS
ncbi:hypothetical protein [Sphingomonas sp. Leaf62]|uniref:hypothetical protein n=1 Tax=Sphingomonas sp. Leaf62 TaxID=1736228 RepID=UPI0012E19592|nr:hypothetical protein [Sphingomonas sp. Leaf62]